MIILSYVLFTQCELAYLWVSTLGGGMVESLLDPGWVQITSRKETGVAGETNEWSGPLCTLVNIVIRHVFEVHENN